MSAVYSQTTPGYQAGIDTLLYNLAHHLLKDIGLAPTPADFDQGCAIRHWVVEAEPAKPTKSGLHGYFLADPDIREIIQVTQQEHPQDQFRRVRRPPTIWMVEIGHFRP